jgi:inorganic triphosphatase YgiF
MSTELELKFLMSPANLPQLLAILPQMGQVKHSDNAMLLNAYFDTASNWFRRHDIGLRSRLKRGQYEQTIKLAGVQHGAMQMRPEYNLPCASVMPQLSDFAAHIWPAHTNVVELQQELLELFRTDFNRQSWLLACSDGSLIELVYDQGQVMAAGHSVPIAELELELQSGDARQLFILARQLLHHLPLRTGWLSKAARGYRLAAQQMLALPTSIGDSLMAQLHALQQAEACYQQQSCLEALTLAGAALSAMATALPSRAALQPLTAEASAMAKELTAGTAVFARPEYNILLLAMSEYLYHNA